MCRADCLGETFRELCKLVRTIYRSKWRLSIAHLLQKGNRPLLLGFADSRAGREMRKFMGEEKGGFSYSRIGNCWHGETGAQLTRSEHPVWMTGGTYLIVCSPDLEGWMEKIGIIEKALIVLSCRSCGSEFYCHMGSGHCPFCLFNLLKL